MFIYRQIFDIFNFYIEIMEKYRMGDQNISVVNIFFKVFEVIVLLLFGGGLWVTALQNCLGNWKIYLFILINIVMFIWLLWIIKHKINKN